MLSMLWDWLARVAEPAAGSGVIWNPGDPTQLGEEFPQWHKRPPGPLPPVINLDSRYRRRGLPPPTVHDQGPIGQCTAAAIATAAGDAWADLLPPGNPPPWRRFAPDPLFVWSKTRVIGANPDPKYGSTLTNAARAVAQFGAVPAFRFPLADLTRSEQTRVNHWLKTGVPDWLETVGRVWRCDVYRANAHDWQIHGAMLAGAGVVVGIPWTFTRVDRDGVAVLTRGNHCYSLAGWVADGPRNLGPMFCVRQSYGSKMFAQSGGRPPRPFGVTGYGFIPQSVLLDAVLDRRLAFALFRKGMVIS